MKTTTKTDKANSRHALTFAELGHIMLRKFGQDACQRGYLTTEPEWVGRYAIQYGDIRPDGTLN